MRAAEQAVDHGPTSPGIEEIEETVTPKEGLPVPSRSENHHPAKVRRALALMFVWLIAGVTAVGAVGWLFFDEDVSEWAVFAAPVFTLASAATAFYFGSVDTHD